MTDAATGQSITLSQKLRHMRDRKMGSKAHTGIDPQGAGKRDDDGLPGTPNIGDGPRGNPGQTRRRAKRGKIGPTKTALSP